MRLFVTGYGPFGKVLENPTAVLAAESGYPHQVLPVTFAAADEFVAAQADADFDTYLLLGVSEKATRLALELVAHNEVTNVPDASGVCGPGPIDPQLPRQLAATIWSPALLAEPPVHTQTSIDPGRYLCNYLFYKMVAAYPERKIGFLHVPPFESIPLAEQKEIIASIIASLS